MLVITCRIQLSCLYSLFGAGNKPSTFQLFYSEGDQSFTTLRLPFVILILNWLLKNRELRGRLWSSPLSCLRESDKGLATGRESWGVCLPLIWIKYGRWEGPKQRGPGAISPPVFRWSKNLPAMYVHFSSIICKLPTSFEIPLLPFLFLLCPSDTQLCLTVLGIFMLRWIPCVHVLKIWFSPVNLSLLTCLLAQLEEFRMWEEKYIFLAPTIKCPSIWVPLIFPCN